MSKHTPAPWTARGENGKYNGDHDWRVDTDKATVSEAAPIWADGRVVAFVVYSSNKYYPDTHPSIDANAKLIAAAPELLEALEEAVQHFNADCKPSWEIKLRWNEALAKAKEQA